MEKYALMCNEYFLAIFGNISILSFSGLIDEVVLFKSHTIEGPRYMMVFLLLIRVSVMINQVMVRIKGVIYIHGLALFS